jgi:phosphopantothenoylcysteine decarboxylase/phosphopantothenate--cysteine ligase
MKALITAGPTQEPIDDVRYITNASSGKMGAALALRAKGLGYDVTLVHGPVQIQLPDCKKIQIRTANEMKEAVMKEAKDADIFISAAAVSDYSPEKVCGKIKSGKCREVVLNPTPKVLDEVRKAFPKLFMVGFKAEFGIRRDELKAIAEDFREKKKLDLVVANDIEKNVFGADETDVIIASESATKDLGKKSKTALAELIWNEIGLHKGNTCPS